MTTDMNDGGRSKIFGALKAELLGPSNDALVTAGAAELFLDSNPNFDTAKDAYGPFVEADTHEEILTRDRPTKRYGVGVLYPREQQRRDIVESDDGADQLRTEAETERPAASIEVRESSNVGTLDQDDDFDLTATGELRPSSMAISFLVVSEPGDRLVVRCSGGRYERLVAKVGGTDREWWVRRPVSIVAEFDAPTSPGIQHPLEALACDPLELSVSLLVRPSSGGWLVTAAFRNDAASSASADSASLFQAEFIVEVVRADQPVAGFAPYPDPRSSRVLDNDAEARSLDLLYRNAPTFAIGHGCAATWDLIWGAETSSQVRATPLPSHETPSTTPDIVLADGTALTAPMRPLAGLDKTNDGLDGIQRIADEYGTWITHLQVEAEALTGTRRTAADDHIKKCKVAHQRIVKGLNWLRSDPTAKRAFVLANRAILAQQLNYSSDVRITTLNAQGKIAVEDKLETKPPSPSWRAFQIGFLVASARSSVDATDAHRDNVELIFFPTGGGKTEAYLGLAAFSLFYQRLVGGDAGVSVLMRYTLRLLTSQQFLRASALVCAMEEIRNEEEDLSQVAPFSIGIWVGGSTTPNTHEQSVAAFNKLVKDNKSDNPFLLLRCPWCAAQMGPIDAEAKANKKIPRIAGYETRRRTVRFFCPDRTCRFNRGLPIHVVDEAVYEERPSIVIGTVDKFAMLAFRPKARNLFGIDQSGERDADPPSLIIQDELHLISGPLGSMVGLYEPIIEELCTDYRLDTPPPPKIVGSTATIRNYADQIKGLYGRESAALFPPHGLDASDSFFAQYAKDSHGELLQGRLYIGVHAPGLGSIQTAQVRTGAALLQAPLELPEESRDPWWTSLMFFNSLRELGTSVSLLQSDIPDYLFTKRLREGSSEQRYVNRMKELTSRLRQDEIPSAIGDLERTSLSGHAIDACLASNIIEVGVDIQRLSLLTILGQPKSTSQYIQITGRVGRDWKHRPGLVVTIYSPSRPRDRSHYEKFQSYHQRLYSEVEPVSVTSFSLPVLKRALHAATIALVRQVKEEGFTPEEMPTDLLDHAQHLFERRVGVCDPGALADLKRNMERIRREWDAWQPQVWEANRDEEGALMRRAGAWVEDDVRDLTWETPMSMRDVDAECRVAVTNRYAVARGAATDEDEL